MSKDLDREMSFTKLSSHQTVDEMHQKSILRILFMRNLIENLREI